MNAQQVAAALKSINKTPSTKSTVIGFALADARCVIGTTFTKSKDTTASALSNMSNAYQLRRARDTGLITQEQIDAIASITE